MSGGRAVSSPRGTEDMPAVNFLDKILYDIKKVESNIATLPFKKEDIRACFFSKVVTCLNSFYNGHSFVELCLLIKLGKLRMPNTSTKEDLHHLNTSLCVLREPWSSGFGSSLNRHLVIDVFAAFEHCINVISSHVISKDELDSMELFQYKKIRKILESNSPKIEDSVINNLKNKLRQKHIPINLKISALYKRLENTSPRNLKEDRNFIEFLSKLRNSGLHGNFIHYGEDCEYNFKDIKIIFQNKESVWFSVQENEFPFFQLGLIEELTMVFRSIVEGIEHKDTIKER